MVDRETPVDDVLRMLQQNKSDPEIIRGLSEQGYSPVQITDALNQARIKKEITTGTEGLQPSITEEQAPAPQPPMLNIPLPASETPVPRPTAMTQTFQTPTPITVTAEYPSYPYQYPTAPQEAQQMGTEAIEEIAEEIVNEKWLEVKNKFSDVIEWKTYAEKRITSIDERIKRIETSMDRLQAALLTKVQEYGRDIKELGAEMAGLQGAFGKILNPFVDNMKELSRITGELKAAKSHVRPKPSKKTVITTTTTVAKPKPKVHHQPKEKVVKKVTVTKTVKK